jgi:ribosomal protein L40E
LVSSDEIKRKIAEKKNSSFKAKTTSNGYLLCEKCGGYYELEPGESPDDFAGDCDCGGKLTHTKTIETETDLENICKKCGTKNPENADFCIKCGKGLGENENKEICPHCGTENPLEAQFCQKCGKSLLNKPVSNKSAPSQDKEYLEVLKKQEKHSKDVKQALFVIFFIVVILPILYWLWWYMVGSR